eukprot:8851918-Prorocentrum_lima.AAC.1
MAIGDLEPVLFSRSHPKSTSSYQTGRCNRKFLLPGPVSCRSLLQLDINTNCFTYRFSKLEPLA